MCVHMCECAEFDCDVLYCIMAHVHAQLRWPGVTWVSCALVVHTTRRVAEFDIDDAIWRAAHDCFVFCSLLRVLLV